MLQALEWDDPIASKDPCARQALAYISYSSSSADHVRIVSLYTLPKIFSFVLFVNTAKKATELNNSSVLPLHVLHIALAGRD